MAQDPWDKDKVVARVRPERGQVVRRPDGSSYVVTNREYTNETPTQLLNQGYMPDETGTYVRSTTVPYEDAPWNQDRAVLPSLPVKSDPLSAFASSATEQIPFLDEAAAGVTGLLTGRPYSEVRALQGELRDFDRQNYGVARNAGGIAGFAAGIAAPASRGAGVARTALEGSAYGALYGLGAGEGSLADRAPGGALGAIGGGAVAGGVRAASPYVARLAGIAGNAARPVRESVARMTGNRPDAEVVAARRFADQLRRRGLSENQIAAETARYREAGLEPSLVDVGGENVMATTRAAASLEGPAREIAVGYRNRVASELAPRTIERTRRLTPDDPRDALEVATDTMATRQRDARTSYGPAYAEQIVVPDVALRALRGQEGSEAMTYARRIASVEQDFDTMEEIDRLITADLDQAPVASGRALEYVRRAYADIAQDAAPELAGGLRTRLGQIDAGLDEIPGLRDARRAYRTASEQIDAVGGEVNPRTGRQVVGRAERKPMSAIGERDAARYETYVQGLPETAAPANQVYQRDQLIANLANAREGAVGPLNAVTPGANQPLTRNSPVVARNLEATFPGQGQQYQRDIELARQQMTRANDVSPNTGSKTANVLQDQASEGVAQGAQQLNQARGQTIVGLALGGIQRLANRTGGLNEAERAAIVQLGLGSADEVSRIFQLADASRASGRRPPREVRAWVVNATGQLGARSPIALELQRVLLPTRVAASEEETRR